MKHPLEKLIQEIEQVDLFVDLRTYLSALQEKPLGLTKTGNLQLKEIRLLVERFRHDVYRYRRKASGEIMFPIRTEDDSKYFWRIRGIAKVMKLDRKYKGKQKLTKAGQEFLQMPTEFAYMRFVDAYLFALNWGYINPVFSYQDRPIAEVLQDSQMLIWEWVNGQGGDWIETDQLVKMLLQRVLVGYERFDRDPIDNATDPVLYVFVNEMEDLGLFETKKAKSKHGFLQTHKFRLSNLGKSFVMSLLIPTHERLMEDILKSRPVIRE